MYILFDIGGTKMRMAVSRDGKVFEEPSIIATPEKFEDAVQAFQEETRRLAKGEEVEAIAGGIRGTLDKERTKLLYEIVLTDWIEKPLQESLETACGAPVYLENDATLAGLGEAIAGAGRGYDIMAYLTVSTGVGGVRIAHGAIDETSVGFEPGKQIIDPDNTLCPDCPGNTLEEYVSGKYVEERFGKPAYEITDSDIWDELARFLAIGLHNTILHWSPDVVVLGGAMITGEPGIDIAEVKKYLRDTMKAFPHLPGMKKAALGDTGGLYGALAYLEQQRIQ